MAASAWILLVSGSSSSGKSTLCHALQPLISSPTVLFEADSTFPLPHAWPSNRSMPPAIVLFHRSIDLWRQAGANAIVDGSLPYGNDELREQCLAELSPESSFVVGVECSVDVLRHREAVRSSPRSPGWGERQAADINDGLDPIVTIDTSDGDSSRHAATVLSAMQQSGLQV